jgi:hypothetical protein
MNDDDEDDFLDGISYLGSFRFDSSVDDHLLGEIFDSFLAVNALAEIAEARSKFNAANRGSAAPDRGNAAPDRGSTAPARKDGSRYRPFAGQLQTFEIVSLDATEYATAQAEGRIAYLED